MKPSAPARPRELTPEEKADQIARFLSQKRESFALSAFAGICRAAVPRNDDPKQAAEWAVQAADALMEKLYPIVKEEGKEPEKPLQTDFD